MSASVFRFVLIWFQSMIFLRVIYTRNRWLCCCVRAIKIVHGANVPHGSPIYQLHVGLFVYGYFARNFFLSAVLFSYDFDLNLNPRRL